MRIAVFGGSFDPVHKEHIGLVQAAIKSLALDKLFVMPAFQPPHKKGKVLLADKDRLEMCRLAFADNAKVEVSDYEIAKGGTSYTYLTCQHFRAAYPDADIYWLVGTDMLRDFPTWRNPQEILQNVHLAVCARDEKSDWLEREQAAFERRFCKRFAVIDYNGTDVSSTKIRILAAAGVAEERLADYTSKNVAKYIKEKALYEISGAAGALVLENEKRREHSLRVAELAAARAVRLHWDENKAIQAALFHDCAKNLSPDSPLLRGFVVDDSHGQVPQEVLHQYAGAYVAERVFGVTDKEVLDAIRYHTRGRPNMGDIEKLIFLADMLETGRSYKGVEELRFLFWKGENLDECLEEALYQTLLFLKEKKSEIYPLTQAAYEFMRDGGEGTEV